MKENRFKNHLLVAGLVLVLCLATTGCSNEDENLKRLVAQEITLIEKQVQAIESHQQNMRKMVSQMETQLKAMRAELDEEAPRIQAANKGITSLRELNQHGLGESPASSALKNPAWNILWVLFFILLLWLFYRFRVKATSKSEQ